MDISTIIGVVVAFGSIIRDYLLKHGVLSSLFLLPPSLIVFGGTWRATILSFGFGEILAALKSFVDTVFTRHLPNPGKLIQEMREMIDTCHKEGLLKLRTILDGSDISGDGFLPLKEGIILTLDMKPTEEIASAMTVDLGIYMVKKDMEIGAFMAAGGFPPTLGVIGTVMDLVQVLSNMTGAVTLMAPTAAAFLAALYGILFANLLYSPMASWMKASLKHQRVYREMMIEGMCLIASGKSARDVEN